MKHVRKFKNFKVNESKFYNEGQIVEIHVEGERYEININVETNFDGLFYIIECETPAEAKILKENFDGDDYEDIDRLEGDIDKLIASKTFKIIYNKETLIDIFVERNCETY